ncbi:hypothetical protein MLD52_04895 [Puniceicoccaceae bacterium K14]|nr:hypothetical protein [Puniceicoccaceae bacterium K14]
MKFSEFAFSAKAAVIVGALATLVLSGCYTPKNPDAMHTKGLLGRKTPMREVTNVHVTQLPKHLRRVAILPFHPGNYEHIDFSVMERNFMMELGKRNLFEIVEVEADEMMAEFEEESFSSIESLPAELLSKLHQIYAIDGILLTDISYYRPYQPVGIGVRLKLLDGRTGEIVWAVDEIFDSSSPTVENSVKTYYLSESLIQYPLNATDTVIQSPARFSKYVAHSVFNTISLQKD